ncbi:hypothetical protein Pla108_32030 [Botrimarina colliarenosi]|uniref:DUF7674 domain-containing protein n=1 Tax=Botrimarina colliarenosi TaxID=2528001 RepID=A0A5C6AAQ1_9BACT|nr:hypothetical protein [Botrimarina colliarenosi]TWT96121.1 hypothetical protein Pla108_32030 [Botrimarina colliarenosi]
MTQDSEDYKTPPEGVAFVEDLVERFDDLRTIFQEHVADNDEILPHLFMGDVTRYVLSGGSQRQELVRHLNDALRTGEEYIENLIAVSFVENLESEEELERALRDAQADALREEWRRQRL